MITPYEGYIESDVSVYGSQHFSVVLVNLDDPDEKIMANIPIKDVEPGDMPLVRAGARFYLMAECPIVVYRHLPRHSITFIRPRPADKRTD